LLTNKLSNSADRDVYQHLRDIELERRLEQAISGLLRDRFFFRAIAVHSQTEKRELEERLIGTVAACAICTPSEQWLGRHSPKHKIQDGKLWQVQNLRTHPIGARGKEAILRAIRITQQQRSACGAWEGG